MNIKPKSSIEIYTDKEMYTQADTVTGKVLLKIKKDFKASDLYIALSGEIYCKTHIHALDKVQGKFVDIMIQEEKRSLFHLKSHLYKFEGEKIKKGEYNIKFNFTLPEKLDYASMHCKGSYGISRDESQHYIQHVKYNLIAWFPPKSKKKKPNLIGKQIIHIKKDHQFDLPRQVYSRKEFTFCFCFTTGHIDMGLKLNKTAYKAQDQLTFDFEYENYPPSDRKPLSIRWSVIRKLKFKGQEYNKPYMQGDIKDHLSKSHTKTIDLPLAMTRTHKSQFVEVINVFQIEYCLPNDVFIPIEQEFAVTQSNAPLQVEGGEDDDNNNQENKGEKKSSKKKKNQKKQEEESEDDDDGSVMSRISDANREEIIVSDVNWNKCNSRLEEINLTKEM